jgi:steroid delta-isomerase-like uncharacterized protein
MSTVEATQQGIDAGWVSDFGTRWLAAWNSHQPDQVLELMTEDIVYDDSAWPRTMRGHADVREFVDHTWRAFPDMTFELIGGPYLHPAQPEAAFHWRGWATHTGPIDPPGVAPTGRRWEVEGVDFHTYREGKVARLVIVFNMADAMRQLGALPAPGSRSERFAVALGNLQTRFRRKG